MDTPVVVAAIAGGAAVISATLVFISARRANSINERAGLMRWAEELRAEATDARQETSQLRKDVASAHHALSELQREVQRMTDEMRLIRQTAWRDDMTMARFREFLSRRVAAAED